MVRNDIVNYITKNSATFAPLVIRGNTTIEEHITKMQVPGEWATQVELQAATEVYDTSLYLYTLTPTRKSYHWICYTPKTRRVGQKHIELAHPSGVHFEVVVDATTNKTSQIPPILTGETVIHPGIL